MEFAEVRWPQFAGAIGVVVDLEGGGDEFWCGGFEAEERAETSCEGFPGAGGGWDGHGFGWAVVPGGAEGAVPD